MEKVASIFLDFKNFANFTRRQDAKGMVVDCMQFLLFANPEFEREFKKISQLNLNWIQL